MFTDPNAVIRITDADGCSCLGGAQHIEPVRPAHLQVADHDVKVAFVQPLERGVAVGRLIDVVTGGGQGECKPPPKGIVIVRYEYSRHVLVHPAFHVQPSCPGLPGRVLFLVWLHRQRDAELRPAPIGSGHIDAAFVRVDDLAHDGQAQA